MVLLDSEQRTKDSNLC